MVLQQLDYQIPSVSLHWNLIIERVKVGRFKQVWQAKHSISVGGGGGRPFFVMWHEAAPPRKKLHLKLCLCADFDFGKFKICILPDLWTAKTVSGIRPCCWGLWWPCIWAGLRRHRRRCPRRQSPQGSSRTPKILFRGDICVASFTPPANGAGLGSFFFFFF